MFLLVAGNPAELQSLENHFNRGGVHSDEIRGLIYQDLAKLPGDDIPDFQVIVVALSMSIPGWQSIATRLKGLAPHSYVTCAFLGNPPKADFDKLMETTAGMGLSLMVITEVNPDRTRSSINALKQRVKTAAP